MPSLNPTAVRPGSWHILDVGSIWMKEFAAALATMVTTQNWCPEIRNFGCFERWERFEEVSDPPIQTIRFPLQRGYRRFPLAQLLPAESKLLAHLLAHDSNAEDSALLLTSPSYAPLAELWPGYVVYYFTNLSEEYASMKSAQIAALDRRMCAVADLVCPNSSRLGDYLSREAGCDMRKIVVIPSATRATNVLSKPPFKPAELPADLAEWPRPVVGVIDNLAGNIDWVMLAEAVSRSRNVTWAFVGPTNMDIPDLTHRQLRAKLMAKGGRVRFLGPKPYGELAQYARSFDAALIPYLKKEPIISGSATRFYEHLAACRPILASRVHAELLSKEPLLKLVSNGEEVAWHLEFLRAHSFADGYEELRWNVSRNETWHSRAASMLSASKARGFPPAEVPLRSMNQVDCAHQSLPF